MLRAAGLAGIGSLLLTGAAWGQEQQVRQPPPGTLVIKVAVCIETSGKISSVELLKSSGDPKLDDMTRKTLKKQTMTPMKDEDGKPKRVCGHHVDIEWPPKN
jgi:TonB family protein